MHDAILAINTGSSSIKFAVYRHSEQDTLIRIIRGHLGGVGARGLFTVTVVDNDQQEHVTQTVLSVDDHAQGLQYILEWLTANASELNLLAVGHRVVHGGSRFVRATRVDASVMEELTELIPLAPLHQPHALHAIEALMAQQAQLPQVACFDTAFHASMPRQEQRFALPSAYEQMGVRRYGFHGLSYEFIASVLPDYLNERANGKVIIAHLGHGVSMCAMNRRQSVATTMSFTPLDGLPMGTRSGALDPAVVLYLLARGMTADEIADLLHHQSGLLGLSGISDDMQDLLTSTRTEAVEAVEYFCYRVSRELGSLAAALAGLDVLVFTGGIGEHAAPVRKQICDAAAWLGVAVDAQVNQADALDITASHSKVAVWVIPTDEEYMIARHTLTMIHSS